MPYQPPVPELIAAVIGSIILPSVIYGVNSVLVFLTLRLFWQRRKGVAQGGPATWAMPTYVVILHSLCTLHWVTSCMGEMISLADQAKPSSPAPNWPFPFGHWGNLRVGYTHVSAYFALTLLTDGLLLWRCWILYSDCCSIVRWTTSTLFLIPAMLSNIGILGFFWINPIMVGSMIFPIAVLTENGIFTALTVGRLLYHQRHMKTLMGPNYASPYTSIIVMVVESASLNIIFQLLAVVFFFADTNHGYFIFNVKLLGQIQVFSTLLIIFRVARGTAWARQTLVKIQTRLQFLAVARTAGESQATRGSASIEMSVLGEPQESEDKDLENNAGIGESDVVLAGKPR